ncbi:MAG: hypothetical protein O7J95_07755 [Planctomycetota bacterium]|nr:hypothetical protein [Planctomycetota bacterium]
MASSSGQATVHVCRKFGCRRPVETPEELLRELQVVTSRAG